MLALVARGTSNRGTADELFVSEATVKTHLTHVYGKFGVRDRAAAVSEGFRRGILGRPREGPGRGRNPVPRGPRTPRGAARSALGPYPRSHNAGAFGGSQPCCAWCGWRQRKVSPSYVTVSPAS
ncbi:hypothetical protein GCM10018785_70020 [Streptomyces longispororuber]|uniref:HTH luxR-type domain-containing protein n=1 Tax=Streptomyces longispororuber TaxID=68230 RepID=A0A919DYR3_9ACTN|nr:hypothetical protein GCM10018785_70020 [Streptomyces longispororuber]